jgi:exopolyphosphatase/guanosine-5'-triphosphate,3'-diphosphate pyrophosphatase
VLVGLIARYHRKGEPDASELGDLALPGDDERLRLLSAIIRLAEQFERSRDGAVREIGVAALDGRVRLDARVDPAHDPSVPIWAARRNAGLLSEALDRQVEIAT